MIQHRLKAQRFTRCFTIALLSAPLLTGCVTRQVSDTLAGSTAQRLVTFSLDQFVEALAEQPQITALKDSTIHLGVHFLKDHQLMDYATRLLNVHLQMTHNITIVPTDDAADVQVDVFFNSIGTDNDDFGLTIPTLGIATTSDGTIDILALDMFHGITEGYAVVTAENGAIEKTERVLARIRRDNVSTPVISFPINQLDE